MAIRNDNLGGTDWVDGEKLYAADLNDTNDAMYNKTETDRDELVELMKLLIQTKVYTVSFDSYDGDVSWLDYYAYSSNREYITGVITNSLSHTHTYVVQQKNYNDDPTRLIYYNNVTLGTTNATPLNVKVGMKEIGISMGSVPINSVIILDKNISELLLLNFVLDNSAKYVYLTNSISQVGVLGGASSHSHSMHKFNSMGLTDSYAVQDNTSVTNNTYSKNELYYYKNTNEYDARKDFLPVGAYLLFLGTAGDIPNNWEYVTDKNNGLLKWANSSYNTQSGTTTHTHTVSGSTLNENPTTSNDYYWDANYSVSDAASHMPPYKSFGLIRKTSME